MIESISIKRVQMMSGNTFSSDLIQSPPVKGVFFAVNFTRKVMMSGNTFSSDLIQSPPVKGVFFTVKFYEERWNHCGLKPSMRKQPWTFDFVRFCCLKLFVNLRFSVHFQEGKKG